MSSYVARYFTYLFSASLLNSSSFQATFNIVNFKGKDSQVNIMSNLEPNHCKTTNLPSTYCEYKI